MLSTFTLERRSPPVTVECVRCHRGLTVPRTLTSQLVNVATTSGADSAVAFYRKAREEHASDGTYDLSERSVSEAARTLVERSKTAEAIALLAVNAELFPKSARPLAQLAMTYEAAGQKEKAIETYKKVWRSRLTSGRRARATDGPRSATSSIAFRSRQHATRWHSSRSLPAARL